MAKRTDKPILTGYDLVNGYVTDKSANSILSEMTPWQMVSKKDKTESWIQWNADYFENLGVRQHKANYNRIMKNRKIAAGILDMSDYQVENGEFSEMIGAIVPEDECDPLKQFYPVAPSIINVLKGEFIKRDKSVSVSCVDKFTKQEKFQEREKLLNEIISSNGMAQKEMALQQMGISPKSEETADRYQQEMEATQKTIEMSRKMRSYKHVMEEWGQHTVNIEMERFKMDELETEAFQESLTNSMEYWHLDLMENDYKVEFLDSKDCFKHLSPNLKYVEDGDYFGWFEDMTVGDIVNKLGTRLKQKHFDQLANILVEYVNYANGAILLTDDQKTMHRPYYDTSKPYPLGATNIAMNEARVEDYLNDFVKNNFKNAGSVDDITNYYSRKSQSEGNPKIFKVMRCYFKSQRKIGWLVKKNKDGTMLPGAWVDEDYKVMDNPKYDTSIDKRKTKENLVYGEHIDWSWVNEWRHVIKINANDAHSFWNQNNYVGGYEPIYLDGERVRFQFKGKDDPYSCSPPIVGCDFRTKGLRPISLIDLVKPGQIIYNVCMNRVPQRILEDMGLQLAINKQTVGRNNYGNQAMVDPLDYLMDNMRNNKIIDMNVDKDLISTIGNAGMMTPQVINLSTINEASQYFNLARMFKEEMFETVGITRQRLGQQKAYETATGIEAGVSYSEAQTEIYFNQHSNELMPRLYQKMIEASQYYASINQSSDLYYRNTMEQNEMLKIEDMNNLLRDYNIYCFNKPSQKAIQQQLKQLFLQDNTLDATALDKAEVLISKSNPEILDKLREAQLRREEKEQAQFEQQQKQHEEQIASQEKMKQMELENKNQQSELDRQSEKEIATIRALGGIQTDVNENNTIDSQENLMKMDLERDKVRNDSDFKNQKLQIERDKVNVLSQQKDKDNATKILLANKKLAESLVNKNKYDDPSLNKKVADKNNIKNK